jgi:hypothetical protein
MRKVILNEISYVFPERSLGYFIEDIDEENEIKGGYWEFQYRADFTDGHWILQEDTKFQREEGQNPGVSTRVIGVAHTREEAQRRTYETALREGKGIAQRGGQKLENLVIVSQTSAPSSSSH